MRRPASPRAGALARRVLLPPAPFELASSWGVPHPAAPGLPWVERASVAIHLRQPGELRRIARELEAADYPVAAGLIDNYALLLERSRASLSRVLAEVRRLLVAALMAPRATRTLHGRVELERDQARTPGFTPRAGSAGTPAPRPAAGPSRAPPLVPMPLPELGDRRRASR
ncbi:MAG TPA: hypothetical protein VNN80_23340 [Polyangiaceae bacterium]|nr:hypothetical protein [Polyangiaceae bacterium]